MIGREAELEVVCSDASLPPAPSAQARALTIVGEAGLGKSRLLAEFQQTLDLDACWLLLGRAHPRSALHPVRRAARHADSARCRSAEGDSGEAARRKLIERLAPLFRDEGEAPIHLLGHLIGLDFSTSPHVEELLGDERALQGPGASTPACSACAASARRRPVIVVLDDLHWADARDRSPSCAGCCEANRDTPLLTLMHDAADRVRAAGRLDRRRRSRTSGST